MIRLRSASYYALGIFLFAGICVVWATGGPKSAALAVGAPSGPPIPQPGGQAPSPTSTLLFVSDVEGNAGTVQAFSLPDLHTAAPSISGLKKPQGLCSGAKGTIWVSDYGTRYMRQYSSSGGALTKFHDKHGYPFACSVDGQQIAIANIQNVNPPPDPAPCASPMSGPGETVVTGVSGTSQQPSYDNPQLYCVDGVAYVPSSPDLYISGVNEQQAFVLGELPANSGTITLIPIVGGPTVHVPGMLQWENGTLYIGDRACDNGGQHTTTCIYSVSFSNSGATITTVLTNPLKDPNGKPICDMAQGVIGGSAGNLYLAGGVDGSSCGNQVSSAVYRWKFPEGGKPTNSNTTALNHPFGTAISIP